MAAKIRNGCPLVVAGLWLSLYFFNTGFGSVKSVFVATQSFHPSVGYSA